jgi:hypothetical protein
VPAISSRLRVNVLSMHCSSPVAMIRLFFSQLREPQAICPGIRCSGPSQQDD